jgi:hypothetical protein
MKTMYFFILLSFLRLDAQVLHHQMLSVQGASVVLSSGMVITQTVGQSSIIGGLLGGYAGGQGFQQQFSAKASSSINVPAITNLNVYPNPFYTSLTVVVPASLDGAVLPVNLFDLRGRLLYTRNHLVENQAITLELSTLPNAIYLLTIHTKTINYSTKIIKQ